jgi:hypothetical protein
MPTSMRAPWTVTAFFDERAAADRAVDKLVQAGFARDAVRLVPGRERDEDEGATAGALDPHPARVGFFNAIEDLLLPEGDRWAYAEGLRRGGFLVSVGCCDDAEHDRALDILDAEGTIDLDEREPLWRGSGRGREDISDPGSAPRDGGPALNEIGSTAIGAAASTATGVSESVSSFGLTQGSDAGRPDEAAPGADAATSDRPQPDWIGRRDSDRSRRRTRSYRLGPLG